MITEKVRLIGQAGELRAYRSQAVKAARDLGYGLDTITRIKEAKTESEIDRIMKSARHKFLKDNWERDSGKVVTYKKIIPTIPEKKPQPKRVDIPKPSKKLEPVDPELEYYRTESIQTAKELYYGSAVIAEIKKAKSKVEIDIILNRARTNY